MKYKAGKQIKSVGDFEKSECSYFKVFFGNQLQTKHRGFMESWQYHTLEMFVKSGLVFEAIAIGEDEKPEWCRMKDTFKIKG